MTTARPMYDGSNIAALVEELAPLMAPATVDVGLDAEAAYGAPPRIVFVGPLEEDFEDVFQQPEDGHAIATAAESYLVHVWGASLAEAQELRRRVLSAIAGTLTRYTACDFGKAKHAGQIQGRQSWAMTIPLRLRVPIYDVQFVRVTASATPIGQVISKVDDPTPQPIPGMS